jgi:hypothetical protein
VNFIEDVIGGVGSAISSVRGLYEQYKPIISEVIQSGGGFPTGRQAVIGGTAALIGGAGAGAIGSSALRAILRRGAPVFAGGLLDRTPEQTMLAEGISQGYLRIGRRRRMNVLNPRALSRSIRRVKGFSKYAKRVGSFTDPGRSYNLKGFKRRKKR